MLSIVVPALERGAESRAAPARPRRPLSPEEVVVVDGGSADATAEVVRRFPAVRFIASPRGRARQMNAGARASRGATRSCSCTPTPCCRRGPSSAIARALADPSVVGGRFDVRFTSPRWPFRMIAALMNRRSRWSGISTGDQGIFVTRAAFDALGGYPDIPLMEDIELTRRLKRLGRLASLDLRVTTSSRKWERDGILRTILLMWSLRFLYFCGVSPARLLRLVLPLTAAARLGRCRRRAPRAP